jgi:nucleotide-binding universal stress UspA family protein
MGVADDHRAGVYSEIVVGTDGSETAGEAVRHAARLAGAMGATLHVVHAFKLVAPMTSLGDDVGIVPPSLGLTADVEGDAKEVLGRAVAAARAEGARAEGHLVRGDPADALIETAEQTRADLVVVGNKGMSGVKRFLLGSVPNKVSHHCPCTLLIVKTAP